MGYEIQYCDGCGEPQEPSRIGFCDECEADRAKTVQAHARARVGKATASSKTKGQLAYEKDCAARPTYDDGPTRRTWDQLSQPVRDTWERNPTARAYPPEAYGLDPITPVELPADVKADIADLPPHWGRSDSATLDRLFDADRQRIDNANKSIASLLNLIDANQEAWDGEEDSVKEEHAELMALNRRMLEASAEWRSKQKGWEDSK